MLKDCFLVVDQARSFCVDVFKNLKEGCLRKVMVSVE